MLNNLITKIKNNKEYLIGLIGVIIVSLVAMLIYYNKSIVNYDGWYNLYAIDILNGKKPYTDFHFLMPPVFLYLWTILQKIFGDAVIVAHGASVICKTALMGGLYHTLTRFYNYKISFICVILSLAIMNTVTFDNCTFSYNEFSTLLVVIIANIMLSFTENLYKERIKYRYVVLLAIFNTLLFFTKQTQGIIVPFASLVILLSILYDKTTWKNILKIAAIYAAGSVLTGIFVFLPLIPNFSLSAYIENVYLGTAAKGSVWNIFQNPVKMIAKFDYLYPTLIFGTIAFIVCILKNYNICNFQTGDKNTESDWIPNNLFSIFLCLTVLGCSYILTVIISQFRVLEGIVKSVGQIANQIGCICEFVIFFMAIYYFIQIFITKNKPILAKKLILYGIFFTTAYALILSIAHPHNLYYIYGITIATLLNYRFAYSKFLNIAVYILILVFLGFSLSLKISLPTNFHGWQGLNITSERKISKLPFLKGMKLSKTEVDVYEDIYDTLDKYLEKDDKIFAYINNQVFYRLLNRQPFYNDHYSLYWDVCSESCASDIFDKFDTEDLSQLPPAIIYLQYPETLISYHELLFRGKNINNSQRRIDIQIKNDIKNNRYKVVNTYNYKKYFMNNKLLKNDFENLDVLTEYCKKVLKNYNYEKVDDLDTWYTYIIIETEQKKLKEQFDKKLIDVNSRFFIDKNYELKVLIRNDLYSKVNSGG